MQVILNFLLKYLIIILLVFMDYKYVTLLF